MSRLEPLPISALSQLDNVIERYQKSLGFVPNSALILARKPKLVDALSQLSSAILSPQGEVPIGFKRLVAYVASKAHGCSY